MANNWKGQSINLEAKNGRIMGNVIGLIGASEYSLGILNQPIREQQNGRQWGSCPMPTLPSMKMLSTGKSLVEVSWSATAQHLIEVFSSCYAMLGEEVPFMPVYRLQHGHRTRNEKNGCFYDV